MSDTMVMKADVRNDIGSKHTKRLRRKGIVPAIVYGHKEEPVNLSFDLHGITEALHHGHRIFEVDSGDKKQTMMVKALQYDHLGKSIIHVDMIRVDLNETVRVTVPIEQKGTSKGSHNAGIIDELLDHLEIECVVSDIPEVISISVKELDVGDSIHAKDVELPAGAKLMTDPNALVLHCHLVSIAKSTEEIEEEMPAGPEAITEKAKEEGEEGKTE